MPKAPKALRLTRLVVCAPGKHKKQSSAWFAIMPPTANLYFMPSGEVGSHLLSKSSTTTSVNMSPINNEGDTVNKDKDLWQKAAYYVHSVSTPTATLQLNVQVLAQYLPLLVEHFEQCEHKQAIPEQTLHALRMLADPMQESLNALQQRTRDFSDQLRACNQRGGDELEAAQENEANSVGTIFPAGYRRIKRLLMIEDEEIHRQVAAKQLHDRCLVDFAANGLEAVEKWRTQAYDLVIMDFLLPGMSGPEALDLMAAVRSPLPVVIGFTNMPDIPEEYSNTSIPVAAYLKKPFKLTNFEALLEHLNLGLDRETQN